MKKDIKDLKVGDMVNFKNVVGNIWHGKIGSITVDGNFGLKDIINNENLGQYPKQNLKSFIPDIGENYKEILIVDEPRSFEFEMCPNSINRSYNSSEIFINSTFSQLRFYGKIDWLDINKKYKVKITEL